MEGYSSDISRSFVFGKPTDKMRKVFDLVRRMQLAALQAARPGVALDTLDRAARKLAEAEGFGPGEEPRKQRAASSAIPAQARMAGPRAFFTGVTR